MNPVRIGDATLYTGDVLDVLRSLPAESVHCVVTSPPYWGLRDYGIEPSVWDGEPGCAHEWGDVGRTGGGKQDVDGKRWQHTEGGVSGHGHAASAFCQKCGAWRGAHGLEPTPELYVQHEVQIFREVRRVLRSDGTAWVNLGDSYAGSGKGPSKSLNKNNAHAHEAAIAMGRSTFDRMHVGHTSGQAPPPGLKAKDLVGIPEQLALALRADGWYWRSRIPWIKRNCMPESCRDRPTTAVEYVMMFSKSNRYYYDREAVKMQSAGTAHARGDGVNPKARWPSGWDGSDGNHHGLTGRYRSKQNESFSGSVNKVVQARNRRNSDWFMESWQGLICDEDGDPLALIVNTQPYKAAHFATFPPRLVKPFILAGCPEGGTVLDPFGGSGTTAAVALEYGRKAILIELKPEYVEMQKKRIRPVAGRPMLAFGGTE